MRKILVVDNEPEIVKVTEQFLGKMGYEVQTALGGEKGTDILRSDARIDLMILDMKMPGKKGMDVLREMKEMNRNMPVIILTGSVDRKIYAEELTRLGHSDEDVIIKPMDLYTLLEMVKKKLGPGSNGGNNG